MAAAVNHACGSSKSPARTASTFKITSAVSCRLFCFASNPDAYWLVCIGRQANTQKLEAKREKTGMRISPGKPFFMSKSRNAANMASIRKIVHTTGKRAYMRVL